MRIAPVLAVIAAAACHGPAPAHAPTDALWRLAPDDTRLAIVADPQAVATLARAVPALRALAATPDFTALAPRLDAALAVVLGRPDATFTDAGLAVDRGAALFVTRDGGTIAIVPVADRGRWVGLHGGRRGPNGDTNGDTIGGWTCRPVRGVYACADDAALLDRLGTGSRLRRREVLTARAGEIALIAQDVPLLGARGELVIRAPLDGGMLDLSGSWRGTPGGVLGKLAGAVAPHVDPAGSSGFVTADVGPLLAAAPPLPLAGGVSLDQLARSLRGSITVRVPSGSSDLQIDVPLADPGPASAVVAHCDELPIAHLAPGAPGTCRLPLQLFGKLELDAWVEGGELRLGAHRSAPARGQPGGPTAIGRELAAGTWTAAMWGRGSILDVETAAAGPLPPAAARAVHLMALVDELGAGVRVERDAVRFRIVARTVWGNPRAVVAKLLAIGGNDVVQGKARATGRALAASVPGSPFAADFAAGGGGLAVPAAVAGIAASYATDALAAGTSAAPAPPPPRLQPMDRAQLVELLLLAYVQEAYPRWQQDHRGKTCPGSLDELAKYLTVPPDVPTRTDPWHHALRLECTAHGIVMSSPGPDGQSGTPDDVRSDRIAR